MEQDRRHLAESSMLPLSVKLCYGIGSFGAAVQGLAASVYLLYFFTEALNIRTGAAANIVFWGRIWDIMNDPLIGFIVDRTHAQQGRCRFYLQRFALPAGAMLAICFIVPELSHTAVLFWATTAYLLQSLTSTLCSIPMNTLMGRLTSNKRERTQLNQFGLFVSLAGNYLVTSYTLPIVSFAGGGDVKRGFMWVGIYFGLVYALSHMIVAWGTRGYEREPEPPARYPTIKKPVHLGSLLQNWVWLCVSLLYLMFAIAITLESSAMVYYYQYVFHDTGLLGKYSVISTIFSFLVFAFLPVFVKQFGNAGVLAIGTTCYIAGHLFRFVLHDSSMAALVVGWILANLGLSLTSSTIILNVFDAKVYGEWKTGVQHDAILMSGFTLSSKIGMAFGSALVGWLLELVPYSEQALTQPPEVNHLLFIINTLVPAAVVSVSLILTIPVMRNEKRLPQMQQELQVRHIYSNQKGSFK